MTRHKDYQQDQAVDITRVEELLTRAPETAQAHDMGIQLAAMADALLDDVGLLVPSKEDRRRLRDGAAALAATSAALQPNALHPNNMSVADLEILRTTLLDGALALQSTDDIGSEELNQKVARDLQELLYRKDIVDLALAQRKTPNE